MKSLGRLALIIFGLLNVPFISAQTANATIAETVGVATLIDQFKMSIESLIKSAEQSGDFLIGRVAIQMRDAIDAWERSNKELIEKTFDKLDDSQRKLFRDIDKTFDEFDSNMKINIDQANDIVVNFSQIIAGTIIGDSDPWVLDYSPRILVPAGPGQVVIRIIGPNLSLANPTIEISDDDVRILKGARAHELVEQVERSVLTFDEGKVTLYRMPFEFDSEQFSFLRPWTWLGSKRDKIELAFWMLPETVGSYTFATRVRLAQREEKIATIEMGEFKGRNTRIKRNVPVPGYENGWRLDVDKKKEIVLHDRGSDKGRCEGVEDSTITQNGLVMYARVDERFRGGRRRDAIANCAISLPLFRDYEKEDDGPSKSGRLGWLA